MGYNALLYIFSSKFWFVLMRRMTYSLFRGGENNCVPLGVM